MKKDKKILRAIEETIDNMEISASDTIHVIRITAQAGDERLLRHCIDEYRFHYVVLYNYHLVLHNMEGNHLKLLIRCVAFAKEILGDCQLLYKKIFEDNDNKYKEIAELSEKMDHLNYSAKVKADFRTRGLEALSLEPFMF